MKRGRGRPPEANRVDQNSNSEDDKDPFLEQFRQRKKRRISEENRNVEPVGNAENPKSTRHEQVNDIRTFQVDPESSGRSV